MEFLKANGIEDHSFVKEMDYQEVLNSQEIFGNELAMFAKKELQKEVINLSIPGAKVYCSSPLDLKVGRERTRLLHYTLRHLTPNHLSIHLPIYFHLLFCLDRLLVPAFWFLTFDRNLWLLKFWFHTLDPQLFSPIIWSKLLVPYFDPNLMVPVFWLTILVPNF